MRPQPTLLLAEDDDAHAKLFLRVLAAHRVAGDLRHVRDGAAALDYLFRQGAYADPATSPRPDVLVLDLRLPKVDGLEVLRRLKGEPALAPLPVVVLTTSDAEADRAQAYAHRANSYLVKPVEFAHLDRLIKDLGQYWIESNRSPW